MTITLGDYYPTCLRCGGDCVSLRNCRGQTVSPKLESASGDDWDLEYVPCSECNGLGARLAQGGQMLLEIMRLSNRRLA